MSTGSDGDDDSPQDGPVARPDRTEGDLYVYSDDDLGDICAEAYAWLRELPELDDDTAEEIVTMFYELATGDWASQLDDTDS